MTTASIKPGWSARAAGLLGDRDALAVLAEMENRLTEERYALDSAVLSALQSGTSVHELHRQSERSVSYIKRLRDGETKTKPVPGDVRALALAWYDTFSDTMMLVAHAHIDLGLTQTSVARAIGSSPSTVSVWVKDARRIAP